MDSPRSFSPIFFLCSFQTLRTETGHLRISTGTGPGSPGFKAASWTIGPRSPRPQHTSPTFRTEITQPKSPHEPSHFVKIKPYGRFITPTEGGAPSRVPQPFALGVAISDDAGVHQYSDSPSVCRRSHDGQIGLPAGRDSHHNRHRLGRRGDGYPAGDPRRSNTPLDGRRS